MKETMENQWMEEAKSERKSLPCLRVKVLDEVQERAGSGRKLAWKLAACGGGNLGRLGQRDKDRNIGESE